MEKIINSLLASPISEAFREPVDWRGLGLEDYPVVIKKPMDLGTVKRLLEKGCYGNLDDVAADVRLIWKNCRTYNCGGVPRKLHKAVDTLDKRFEAHFAKLKHSKSVGIGCKKTVKKKTAKKKAAVELPPVLSDADRAELMLLLGRIRSEQRTAVVHEIDRLCPEALALNGDTIDIDVDRLDAKTFMAVERVVAPQAVSRLACNKRSAMRCNGSTSASDAASVVGGGCGNDGKDPLRVCNKRSATRCNGGASASDAASVVGGGRGNGGKDPLRARNKRPAARCSRSTSASDVTSAGVGERTGGMEDPLRARNKRPAAWCNGDNSTSDATLSASEGVGQGGDDIEENVDGLQWPCKKAKV